MGQVAHDLDQIGVFREISAYGPVEYWLLLAVRGFAMLGGMTFIGLVGMSMVSIICRKVGGGPITGDVELMQIGTAIGAAAFIPYCTMLRDHLRVEFFTDKAPKALKNVLDTLAHLLLGVALAVLAWRTGMQVFDVRQAGEVTTLLSIPAWIPIALMVPSFMLAAVCAFHLAWDRCGDGKGACS